MVLMHHLELRKVESIYYLKRIWFVCLTFISILLLDLFDHQLLINRVKKGVLTEKLNFEFIKIFFQLCNLHSIHHLVMSLNHLNFVLDNTVLWNVLKVGLFKLQKCILSILAYTLSLFNVALLSLLKFLVVNLKFKPFPELILAKFDQWNKFALVLAFNTNLAVFSSVSLANLSNWIERVFLTLFVPYKFDGLNFGVKLGLHAEVV